MPSVATHAGISRRAAGNSAERAQPVLQRTREALAEQVLAAVGEPLLYARIDMVPGHDGRWMLMEAELIEPDFYRSQAPDGGRLVAEAVRTRLASAA